jgi:GR25 family glycosyltransferase involved in LPS biosynthesis
MKPLVFNEENTFCITMENSPRWDRMQYRIQMAGLSATKWNASTRDTLTDSFSHHLNNGQKGCSQSHINIYKHMILHQIEYAFVLEDDACFDRNWKEKLDTFYDTIQDETWDLILLNASEPIHPLHQWTRVTEQYLTAGYIISLRGVMKIIKDFHGCYCSSDWMTSRLQLYQHSYSYFPWLIIQEGKDTSIGNHLEADHAKVVCCLYNISYSLENYILDESMV